MRNHIHRSLRTVFARFEEAERRYRDRQTLSNMSDYELDDIGLTRGDIASAIRTGRRPARR